MNHGYTLLELLIIVAVIGIVAVGLIAKINPSILLQRGLDAQKKRDMQTFRKVMEDFYNDKNRYPLPTEICYNGTGEVVTCNICGYKNTSSAMTPYIGLLPCDRKNTPEGYTYIVDSATVPTFYRIYTNLFNTNDSIISEVGCNKTTGCPNNASFNFGLSSPNTGL